MLRTRPFPIPVIAFVLLVAGCLPGSRLDQQGTGSVTVYSGRSEALVGPVLQRLGPEIGINVQVRYGDSAALAAAILEEGANSPADVFFSQDAGALGALAQQGKLSPLPSEILNQVGAKFRSPRGEWVGVSGRARTVAYNTNGLREEQLPDSVLGFVDPQWNGRIGWAPTNASFQAFVTALRLSEGESQARRWLDGIKANNPKAYGNNTAIVHAVATGEIQVGFVNHYYLYALQKDQGPIPVRNYHPRAGDSGAMINVAGAGILSTSKNLGAARRFLEYLLSASAQQYFVQETFEYPLVAGVSAPGGAPPLDQIRAPSIDLSSLADLDGTLRLLRETGIV